MRSESCSIGYRHRMNIACRDILCLDANGFSYGIANAHLLCFCQRTPRRQAQTAFEDSSANVSTDEIKPFKDGLHVHWLPNPTRFDVFGFER